MRATGVFKRRRWSSQARSLALLPIVGVVLGAASAAASDWTRGDLIVGVSGGSYQIRDGSGGLKETITGPFGGSTTGCAFNNDLDKLYTTFFDATKVVVFNVAHPHGVAQTIDTAATSPGGHSESIVFAANGHFYVGHPDGNRVIQEYDASGTLVTTFAAAIEGRGTDWLTLTSDQTILYYTSEGRHVKRFNVATNTQLPDFADLGGPLDEQHVAYAVRLLAPGDGSGGVLVADTLNIKRVDGAGNVVQTYDAAGEDSWFALTLDPDGTSFWSANFETGNVFKFDIASGNILVQFNTGTGGNTVFGLCQMEDRPPIALCHDVTVPTDPGVCQAANASIDNGSFDPDTAAFGDTITLSQAPPGPYSLGGPTNVTLTVTDNLNKAAQCSGTVTVVDQEKPIISCPAPQRLECTSPSGADATVVATATDNCSVSNVGCVPGSGTFPLGTTAVSCTATDGSNNTSSCSSSVQVVDTTPPVVACVPSVNPSGGNVPPGTNPDGFYQVSATDICTLASNITIKIGNYTLAQGETIKIVQAPGTSGVTLVTEMGPLHIKLFRVGPNDGVITATDGSGVTGNVTCLVPPPPK